MKFSIKGQVFPQITIVDKLFFTKYLAVMIKSGISLHEAIETIMEQTSNEEFKKILKHVSADVSNGQSLENALKKFPKVFDPLYINLIKIGEESGNLESNLFYLANLQKKNYDFRKKVQGALLYPEIIIVTAVIVLTGISIFVLPQLANLFSSLHVTLPWTTKLLLFIASTMKNYGVFIISGFVAFAVLFKLLISLPSVRPSWEKCLFFLPTYGQFLQDVQLAYFARNFGVMLQSGLPIVTALQAQADATTHAVYKTYVLDMLHSVEKGKSIADLLSDKKHIYIPRIAVKMIAIGEKTGKLDEALNYLGDFFEEEVDGYASNFSTILEPLVLIAIGIGVAFVAFAIITPIYNLTGSIHQ